MHKPGMKLKSTRDHINMPAKQFGHFPRASYLNCDESRFVADTCFLHCRCPSGFPRSGEFTKLQMFQCVHQPQGRNAQASTLRHVHFGHCNPSLRDPSSCLPPSCLEGRMYSGVNGLGRGPLRTLEEKQRSERVYPRK